MSPAVPADEEAAPPVQSRAVPAAWPAEKSTEAVPTSSYSSPTTASASEPRETRNKDGCLDLAPVVLRIAAAAFSIISLGVLASNTEMFAYRRGPQIRSCDDVDDYIADQGYSVHFYDYFFLTYLLIVNAITVALLSATIALSALYVIWKIRATHYVSIGIVALDLILSYLLLSASTSAMTGIRIRHEALYNYGVSNTFFTKVYVPAFFSYAAFFVLGLAVLLTALRLARRS